MEPSFNVPDSTDWLDTPLGLLMPLESSLRCQVCKDFFDNPVITSCSHTFCSLCIRRCLSTEGKCPMCRSSDQELKLRRNWAVQELVEAFINARPSVLGFARKVKEAEQQQQQQSSEPVLKKRKVGHSDGEDDNNVEVPDSGGRRTRSRSKRAAGQNDAYSATVEVIDDTPDEDYVPEDGLVACPVCNRRMKNEVVFQHLDTCTGKSASSKQASFGSLQSMSSPPSRNQSKNFLQPKNAMTKPPERLPTINYSLLKDTVLRKKLKDLGIPQWGPRPLLQKRHTEWMNLWNANCDSKIPKSKRDLLQQLDVWERTQGGMVAQPSTLEPANTVMRKDFDAAAWSTNHEDDFKRLIANARKKSDAVVRTTIPQTGQASNEPENAPKEATPITTSDSPKPTELPVDISGVTGAGTDFTPKEIPSSSQEVDAPPG